jgi:CrcB protein
MIKLAVLMLAGGLGTLARFGLSGLVHRLYGGELPLGTFVVNITGCFLFGLIWTLAQGRLNLSAETRSLVLVGFMGAFTTFSTYAYETSAMLQESQWLRAAGNLAAHNLLGILAVVLGMALGRVF